VPVSFPLEWDDLERVTPGDFTLAAAPDLFGTADPWSQLMPEPQPLPPELVDEGRAIPIARVQAMHEGKRRKRAAGAN
jgi:DNA primase